MRKPPRPANPREPSWGEVYALIAERGEMTLAEIAVHFGVSRERIRQIESAALEKLREAGAYLELPADIDHALEYSGPAWLREGSL